MSALQFLVLLRAIRGSRPDYRGLLVLLGILCLLTAFMLLLAAFA
jgi:hypothetical protein